MLPEGEDRAVIYKPVQLPVDLIEDLKMYKDAYVMLLAEEEDEWGNPIPVHVSYEQIDKELAFYAIIDGVKKGAEQLINEEYELQNDAAVVLDLKDAYRVSKKILRHMEKA